MKDKEWMDLLAMRRHDWMNQVQLLKGYLAMGKTEKLKEILTDIEVSANEERKLFATGARAFSLWLLSFSSRYDTFRLRYYLEAEVDLSKDDEWLVSHAHDIMDYLSQRTKDREVYEGSLHIDGRGLTWKFTGEFLPEKKEAPGKKEEQKQAVTIMKDWNK